MAIRVDLGPLRNWGRGMSLPHGIRECRDIKVAKKNFFTKFLYKIYMYKKWLGLLHASKFSESFGGYRKKIIVLFNLINFKFMKYLVLP